MKILLDTNAYSALLKGDQQIVDLVRETDSVIMSSVVIGELLFGFHNGNRFMENQQMLREFLGESVVVQIGVSYVTADYYGKIAARLKALGKPIPTNDIWIAAHAMEIDAKLVSYDIHFEAVEALNFDKLKK